MLKSGRLIINAHLVLTLVRWDPWMLPCYLHPPNYNGCISYYCSECIYEAAQLRKVLLSFVDDRCTIFLPFFGFKTDEHTFSQRQPIDQDRGWRKRQYDEMAEGRAVDGANGNKMTREGRIASDDQRFEGDDIWYLETFNIELYLCL